VAIAIVVAVATSATTTLFQRYQGTCVEVSANQ